jgi:hypothetical protein
MITRRVAQEEEENLVSSIPKTILWSILTGIGLGIGFFIVRKVVEKR